ncbi:MAG TPA: RNA polymerase factor sigma-54 [Verrucomicrobiae bacterium]|nr:RNA polymerase factor sigma-54 [Verrucomicrobiae bacterium]
MDTRLIQNQSQKLILSPQIRQYLRLLQMPIMELAQAVDVEMTENPMLEEKNGTPDEDGVIETPAVEADGSLPEVPAPASKELQLGESFDNLSEWGRDFDDNSFDHDSSYRSSADLQKQKDFKDSLLTQREGLSDYLLSQSRFLELSAEEKKIVEVIVGNIDDQGYLKATIEEMAAALNVTPEKVAAALEKVQQLEPAGIGARNLQEALLLQLKRLHPEAELARQIVQEQLPLLEKRDWPQLARVLDAGDEEIKEAAEIIMRLEPRPGRRFNSEDNIAVTPDAVVTYNENSTPPYKIEVVNERIPELRINAYYRKLLRTKDLDDKTKEFLKEKMQSALNFLKAIQQRRSTLYEITDQILKEQLEFFDKGFSHLKPLRLKDIAANLGIHESTVSRAIHGKYIQTPQGTIPFRSFFSSKLETTSGEAESQKSIMEKLKKLISGEDAAHPLSDQELVAILKKDGVVIARRTVAKYRDLLRILPSHLRRKR